MKMDNKIAGMAVMLSYWLLRKNHDFLRAENCLDNGYGLNGSEMGILAEKINFLAIL